MKITEVEWEDYKTVIIETKTFYMAIKLPKDEKIEINPSRHTDEPMARQSTA